MSASLCRVPLSQPACNIQRFMESRAGVAACTQHSIKAWAGRGGSPSRGPHCLSAGRARHTRRRQSQSPARYPAAMWAFICGGSAVQGAQGKFFLAASNRVQCKPSSFSGCGLVPGARGSKPCIILALIMPCNHTDQGSPAGPCLSDALPLLLLQLNFCHLRWQFQGEC